MWTRKDLRSDLIGLRVGKLEIIKFVGVNEKGHTVWKARCDCGKLKEVIGKEFKRGKGGTKCNDCHIEEKRNRAKKHGDYGTKFYLCWDSMKKRCNNQSDFKKWINYGGRGIKYDPDWFFYENFKKDMYFKYVWAKKKYKTENLTLERLDNNKGYNFENCEFILLREQAKNRRIIKAFKAISPNNKIYLSRNMYEFGRKHDLNPSHIGDCLRKYRHNKTVKGWVFKYL